jgi:hypothetical protein
VTDRAESMHDEIAKLREAQAQYERTHSRRWKLMRDECPGAVLYFGQYRGARFVSIDLRGFSGWSSSRWLPGGWEFFNPTLHVGRLYMDASRSWSREVHIPAKLWDFYYWRIKPSGRRYRREHGHDEPLEAERA